jgi:hypothetical protein
LAVVWRAKKRAQIPFIEDTIVPRLVLTVKSFPSEQVFQIIWNSCPASKDSFVIFIPHKEMCSSHGGGRTSFSVFTPLTLYCGFLLF